jgi:hypothetical protein
MIARSISCLKVFGCGAILAIVACSGRTAARDAGPAPPPAVNADSGDLAGNTGRAVGADGDGASLLEAGNLDPSTRHPGPTPYTLFVVDQVGYIRIGAVAVDRTHVYWAGNNADLLRRAIDGSGQAEHIADWQGTLLGLELAVDQDYVYWLDMSSWFRAPKAGGTPEQLPLEGQGSDVAADEQYAYAAVAGCAAVARAPHGALTSDVIYPLSPIQRSVGGTYLLLDGTDVYCAAGHYVLVSHDWGPLQELTSAGSQLLGVAVLGGEVYWFDQTPDRQFTNLYRSSANGQIVLVGAMNLEPNRPCADPTRRRLLFTTGGAVVSMSTETGAWKMLALSTYPGPCAASDGQFLYWGRFTSTEASIERMPFTQE